MFTVIRRNNGSGKVLKICMSCNKNFYARHDRLGKYCSKSCASKEKLHILKRTIVCCKICKKEFEVLKCKENKVKMCSKSCRLIWLREMNKGDNHPNWKGGSSERTHKSRSVIRNLVKRIGKCERCGAKEQLQGHHKVPYFKDESLRECPENIEVLCSRCHSEEHQKHANLISFIRKRHGVNLVCNFCLIEYYVPKHKQYTSRYCSNKCQRESLYSKRRNREKK